MISATASAGPVRPGLAFGLEQRRGGQDPAGQAERGRREAARVARPVEPLLDLTGEPARRCERPGPVQHPLGVVRVQAHAFPLRRAERAGLVPDRVGDAEPARSRRPARPGARAAARPAGRPRSAAAAAASVATASEWPRVDGDFRSTNRAIAARASSHSSAESVRRQPRLAVDHHIPGVELVELVEDLLRVRLDDLDESRGRTGSRSGGGPARAPPRRRRSGRPPRGTRRGA